MHELKVTCRHNGWLSHYFHFLIDFAHPFHGWYAAAGLADDAAPLVLHLQILDESDSLHEMRGRFAQLYPNVTIDEVTPGQYAALDCDETEIVGWKRRGRTFDPESVVAFGRYHGVHADVRVPTGKDVIFIDRGVEAKETGRKNGALRRNISNGTQLARALQAEFGDRFERVVLEEMSVHEQIRVFRHGQVFIGSHGAGFANILFCERTPASMVEVFDRPEGEKRHFITLAAARGMGHHYVRIPKIKAPVDVRAMVNLAKDCVASDPTSVSV